MSHARFTAALLLARQASLNDHAHRDFVAVACLAEAAVASATTPWRHAPVGAAMLKKKAARAELVRLLEALPWWWARIVLAAWRRERPMRAAERWLYGCPEHRRERWEDLIRRAGRAAAAAPGDGAWLDRVIRQMPLLGRRRGDPVRLALWMREAAAEGWRPPGVEVVLHTGPMGSGKSSALVAAAGEAERPLVVQPAVNSRDGAQVRTHDGASVPAVATDCLWREVWRALYGDAAHEREIRPGRRRLTVIVDEGQWFDRDDWERALAVAAGHEVRFVVAALDWSAQRTRLGCAEWLIGVADRVEWHRGRCADCGAPSVITRWDGEGAPGVGSIGVGAYRPVCDGCWRAPAVDGGGQ